MAIYLYLSQDQKANRGILDALNRYVDLHQMSAEHKVVETQSVRTHWQERVIGHLVEQEAQKGDAIVVYEAADLARSTCQTLELLMSATVNGVDIHFVKYHTIFRAKERNKLTDLLELMQHIESDFISRRTTDALARRRAAGLPLGRPKGRKNKSLKLDKHRKDIVKYLELGISKASIAKLVGCHPQTLYDWIDRQDIEVKKVRKTKETRAQLEAVVKELESA